MKAARLHAIGDFRVDEIAVPQIKNDELLIKVGACGVCGSDIPRVFELGLSVGNYPLTIGHEFGGVVVDVANPKDSDLIGKRGAIFPCIPCMKCDACAGGYYPMCENYGYLGSRDDGGFAEYCVVPSRWHFVEAQDGTPFEALAMTEPCAVAQHAIRKGKVTAGHNVLIFGAGPIGIMAARWAKLFGADTVMLVDVLDEKVKFAKERGIDAVNSTKQDILESFKVLSNGHVPDVVIEGTGTGAALGQAIRAVKTLGVIVLMGNPHKDTTIKLAEHSAILRKEIELRGIWNSHYCNVPVNEWEYTVKMMGLGHMQVLDLITHTADIDGIPDMLKGIYNRELSICKAMYCFKDESLV